MGVKIAAEVQVTQLHHRGHSSNLVTVVTTPAATKYFDHPDIVCITDSILESQGSTKGQVRVKDVR